MKRIVCLGDSLTSGHGIGTPVALGANDADARLAPSRFGTLQPSVLASPA